MNFATILGIIAIAVLTFIGIQRRCEYKKELIIEQIDNHQSFLDSLYLMLDIWFSAQALHTEAITVDQTYRPIYGSEVPSQEMGIRTQARDLVKSIEDQIKIHISEYHHSNMYQYIGSIADNVKDKYGDQYHWIENCFDPML